MSKLKPVLFVLLPLAVLLGSVLLATVMSYQAISLFGGADRFGGWVRHGGTIIAALALLGLAGGDGLRALGWNAAPRRWLPGLVAGIGVGLATLGLHCVALVALGVRSVEKATATDLAAIVRVLGKTLPIGFSVAIPEEIVFRGLLLAILLRGLRPATAIGVSGFYFAMLHFLPRRWALPTDNLDLSATLSTVASQLTALLHPDRDSFLALWVVGVFLGVVRLSGANGLAWCIGLHAGWVAVIKSAKILTHGALDNTIWVGHYDGIIGLLSALWLAALTGFLVYFRHLRHKY